MAGTDGAEYGLRTRVKEDRRPLSQLTNRERGLRAAADLLKGSLTREEAMAQYGVDRHTLGHYKMRLQQSGFDDIVVSVAPVVAPAPGSTPATNEQPEPASVLAAKTAAWDAYCHAYIYAGELIAKKGMSKREAARQASEKHGVALSPSTALRASQHLGEPPSKRGRTLILGADMENKLESLCLILREMRIPIFHYMILNYANSLVKGTELEEQFKHREVRRHWYYNWLGRSERLRTGNIRPLEVTRAKWATPANVLKHYEMLAEILVETGIAINNPDFDEEKPLSEPVYIIKPGRLFSMDETRLTNDTTATHKGRQCRSILGAQGDDGTTLVNKGGGDGTGIGGSGADGLDVPAFFIFANNIIHAGAQDSDVAPHVRPRCRRVDPATGKPLECRFWANQKGGVTGDLGIRWIRGCLMPCIPDMSPDNPAVLIMDGHGSHFTLELLTFCRAVGLHVVLRPPHTTHVLQGEDVEHFGVFKELYQRTKLTTMATRLLSGKHRLTAGDLLYCAKDAWEMAFNMHHSLRAWEKIGVSPFTRKVYWDLVAARQKRDAVAARAS